SLPPISLVVAADIGLAPLAYAVFAAQSALAPPPIRVCAFRTVSRRESGVLTPKSARKARIWPPKRHVEAKAWMRRAFKAGFWTRRNLFAGFACRRAHVLCALAEFSPQPS